MENRESVAFVERVLVNEISNEQNVYLYLEDNKWCAYERSAYYLAQLGISVQLERTVIRGGFDVILLKASLPINDMSLSNGSKMKLKRLGETDLHFQLSIDIKGFVDWKRSQLGVLTA